MAFCVTIAVINFAFTSMIAWKIFSVMRETESLLGSRVHNRYTSVVVIIVESGIMYPIAIIISLAIPGSKDDAVSFLLHHIVGIVPSLIIVRVGIGNSLQKTKSYLDTLRLRQQLGTRPTISGIVGRLDLEVIATDVV
ncbi:hypothetical protein PM082_021915 [Marasmius tenuissimus]|nr:hypothetical protein PM082_021915 [Marasmius tenuissimus]